MLQATHEREGHRSKLRQVGGFFVDWRVHTVGVVVLTGGFAALPFVVGPTPPSEPTPTPRHKENTVNLANIPAISTPNTSPALASFRGVPIELLVAKNFSTTSDLRQRILDRKYQNGDDAQVSTCTNELGQPLTGKIALPEVNVRNEPGTTRPFSRKLYAGNPIVSRIKATVTNWQRKFVDTWRGIEDDKGNIEFVAEIYNGKTNVDMGNQRELCGQPIDLEPYLRYTVK